MKYITFIILLIILNTATLYGQSAGSKKFKSEFLDRINKTRKKGCKCGTTYMPPAPPLTWNDILENAAIGHAQDMAINNYFSHDSKDGRSLKDRTDVAGYDEKGFQSFTIGENIAQGQQTIAEVMDGWLKSEGHCRNLMNPAFKEVGVALYNTYWVQDFGGREPFSPEMQKMLKSGKYHIIERSKPAQ